MTVAVANALNTGLRAHRAGHLDQAIAVYGAVLNLAPDHATARHLRGFALLQNGQAEDALSDLEAAVRRAPGNANAWTHLAVCLNRLGKSATDAARCALAQLPTAQEALDVLLRDKEAGTRPLPWLLALTPGHPTAWSRAGHIWARSDPTLALAALRRAQCLAPSDPSSGLDLADLERRSNRPEAAQILANRMLTLRPNDPRGLAERAAAATELDAVTSALADTRQALTLDPGQTTAWGNRAETLYRLADYEAATRCGERARMTAPADLEVLANLAAYRLATGDLAMGWRLFRHRPARRNTAGPELPRWTGEAAASLLVLAEQGLGDELLFSTLWSDLDRLMAAGKLGAVTVEADERLIPLGARARPRLTWRQRLRTDNTGGPFTHWCLAGDLPEVLRPEPDSFGSFTPGLRPDPDRVTGWRTWLDKAAGGRPAIGLCWRSGSRAGHRRRHYPTLDDCAPLLAVPNRFFVVLQYDDCRAELDGLSLGAGSEIVLPPELDRRADQEGVAALMTALDLVVSADTAVLSLAGAIGVPTIGLSLHAGWVGLGERQHPWFPNVARVYRPPDVSWRETMAAVARSAESALAIRP